MMLISTSRRPSTRTRSFVKELLGVIPLSFQVTRGKKSIEELKDIAVLKGCRRLMIVESRDGNPSALSFMHIDKKDWKWLGVMDTTVSLRREMKITHKIDSFDDDLPLLIKGDKGESFDFVKEMFSGMDYDEGVEAPILLWNGEFINFLRDDVSSVPIGPKINVLKWKRLI